MQKLSNYINGELVAPVSGSYLDNYNPAEGKVYSLVPDSDERDVALAARAAKQAFDEWSSLLPEKRSSVLIRIADLIDRDLDKLARAESIDNGKTLKLAKSLDIPRASANLRFFCNGIDTLCQRITHYRQRGSKLYVAFTVWCSRLYFAMESSALLVHMENCSCIGSWLYRCSKTFGANSDDRISPW
jgi:acyl-CoA reductase-like NAD-dependent aldehyde dehydrogenase